MAKKSYTRSTKRSSRQQRRKSKKGIWQRLFTFGRLGIIIFIWAILIIGGYIAVIAYDLPTRLKNPNVSPSPSVTFLARDGSHLARYGSVKSDPNTPGTLPDILVHAILSIEDRNFYRHNGIDPFAIGRAAYVNLNAGGVVQGGSTITQQLAKNLFLTHDRTINRKIREVLAALWLEYNFTKDEILTAYTNHVYMGAGIYGMKEAARYYFNKDIQDLSLIEAATFAGMLKAPSRYAPTANPSLSHARAVTVIASMVDAGYLSEDKLQPYIDRAPRPPSKPVRARAKLYFTDYAIDRMGGLIPSPRVSVVVRTTLDPRVQTIAEKALGKAIMEQGQRKNVMQGAIIVMKTNGEILAMVGGVDYKDSQFNRAVQAIRPPGSAFKPVVYLTALKKGWNPEDTILDAPFDTKDDYRPRNFDDGYEGEVTLTYALAQSLNTASVRLMQEIGPGDVMQTARKLGITTNLERDLSLALGSGGVTLLELCTAYAIFANQGHSVSPVAIRQIEDSAETPLYIRPDRDDQSVKLFEKHHIAQLNHMLEDVVESGTGQRADPPYRAAGKTGTSQDHRDAWFIGYAGQIVVGVWLGNDDNSPLVSDTGPNSESAVVGGGLPADIWRNVIINMPPEYDPALTRSQTRRDGFTGFLNRLLSGGTAPAPIGQDTDKAYDFNN